MQKSLVRILTATIFSVIFVVNLTAGEQAFYTPQLKLPPELIHEYSRTDIENFVEQKTNSDSQFKAGVYYLYWALVNEKSADKGEVKKSVKKSIALLKNVIKSTPANPLYTAVYGTALAYNSKFIVFPFVIWEATKGPDQLNKAVSRDKDNPEIRLLRLRSFSHYPKKYYGHYEQIILDDYKAINHWIDEYKNTSVNQTKLASYSSYFDSLSDEVNYWVGLFYASEDSSFKEAKAYLEKVNPSNKNFYSEARDLLKKVSK
jgi:hypothetical protein